MVTAGHNRNRISECGHQWNIQRPQRPRLPPRSRYHGRHEQQVHGRVHHAFQLSSYTPQLGSRPTQQKHTPLHPHAVPGHQPREPPPPTVARSVERHDHLPPTCHVRPPMPTRSRPHRGRPHPARAFLARPGPLDRPHLPLQRAHHAPHRHALRHCVRHDRAARRSQTHLPSTHLESIHPQLPTAQQRRHRQIAHRPPGTTP